METKKLIITIIPSQRSIANKLGYDFDNEDAFGDAALYSQGYYIEEREIEPGDTFKITKDVEKAVIDGDSSKYKLKKQHNYFDEEDQENSDDKKQNINLSPGKYKFHEDGVTIELIEEFYFDFF